MKLRIKILLGFLILALMLFIAGIWSIYELNSIGTSVEDILEENYKSINASKIMIEALEREDSGILLLILGNWEEGRSTIAYGDSLFNYGFYIASNNVTVPGEQFYIDSIRTKYQAYKNIWERPIIDTQKQGNLNWYSQVMHKSFLDVKSAVNNLMSLNEQVMFKTASETKNKAHRAIMPGIVAIISALVFTFLFNYFISYYFVGPIVKITDNIRRFVDNQEPFDIQVETKDEISDLVVLLYKLCNLVKFGK